jgi:hypothetical protein
MKPVINRQFASPLHWALSKTLRRGLDTIYAWISAQVEAAGPSWLPAGSSTDTKPRSDWR